MDSEQKQPVFTRHTVIFTLCLSLVFLCQGLINGVKQTSLAELKEYFHTTFEQLHTAIAIHLFGAVIGGCYGGFINDYHPKRRAVLLAVCLFLTGIVHIAIPFSKYLVLLGSLEFFQGWCRAASDVVSTVLVIQLWADKSAVSLLLADATRPCGQVVAILLTDRLLTFNLPGVWNSTIDFQNASACQRTPRGSECGSNLTFQSEAPNHYLLVASYGVTGIISIISAIIISVTPCFLSTSFFADTGIRNKVKMNSVNMQKVCVQRCAVATVGTILFMAYAGIAASGVSLATHIASGQNFATDGILAVTVVYFILVTVGRVVWAIAACCITIKVIAPVAIFAETFTGYLMAFIGLESNTLFWFMISVRAFMGSAAYPALMAVTDRYLKVTGILVAVVYAGSTVGAIVAVLVNDYALSKLDDHWLLVASSSWSSLVLVSTVLILVSGCLLGDRFAAISRGSGQTSSAQSSEEEYMVLLDNTEEE